MALIKLLANSGHEVLKLIHIEIQYLIYLTTPDTRT